jgi:hypothetical protein
MTLSNEEGPMTEPECICSFSENSRASYPWDPACYYHGDNGTMVSRINLSRMVASESSPNLLHPTRHAVRDDRTRRVTIQLAVGRLVEDLAEEAGPLSDGERLARLLAAADDVALVGQECGDRLKDALLRHVAEGQAWLEELVRAEAR